MVGLTLTLLAPLPGALSRPREIAAPTPERLPEMARELAEKLRGRKVRLPDGAEAPLVAEEAGAAGVLTTERLAASLGTVSEAEAWPAAWLVVQDLSRDFDLVMRLEMGEDGQVRAPETVFTTSRREWDDDVLLAAVREATGRKPARERERNVVVQSFSERFEDIYIYEMPRVASKHAGLLALLPEGSFIREAKTVDLGDGTRRTLALVLREARFVPSECGSCASRFLGHADTGALLVVLAGEKVLEDEKDLTGEFLRKGRQVVLPRHPCTREDEEGDGAKKLPGERFRGREPIGLLALEDHTGDGKALEFALPFEVLGCDHLSTMIVGVTPEAPRLRLYPVVEGDRTEPAAEGLDLFVKQRVVETAWKCGEEGARQETRRVVVFDPDSQAFRVIRRTVRECPGRGERGAVIEEFVDPKEAGLLRYWQQKK